MPTCPNCGSVIMEGDPYCQHCGAHFMWDFDDEPEEEFKTATLSWRPKKEYSSQSPHFEDSSEFVPGAPVIPDPFLDFGETSQTYKNPNEKTLEEIADAVCKEDFQKLQLKAKIRQYMKAKDFQGFYIKKDWGFDVFYFHFIQENEYVSTTHVMTFFKENDHYLPNQTFRDSYSRHDHDGLLSNPRFKNLMKDHELVRCHGGYVTGEDESYDVTLTGEIDIKVYLNVNGEEKGYDLDLERMKLNPKKYY